MSNTTARPQVQPFVLLLGLDLEDTESSGYAFRQAACIGSRIPCCALHVVHVAPANATDAELDRLSGLLRLYISESASALHVQGPDATGLHVRRGEPAKEIAQLAAEANADMIVVGTRKRPQLKTLFVGSTAGRVMAATECPVFVAGPRPAPEPSRGIVIDPPCPDCVVQRQATHGREWWCARHAEPHHLRRHHVYSYSNDWPFGEHDSAVSPTGTG